MPRSASAPQCLPRVSLTLGKITPQRILPVRHADAVLMQAARRQHRILGACSRTHELVTGSWPNRGFQPRAADDGAGELEPDPFPDIGGVDDAARLPLAQFTNCPRQVHVVRW